MSFKRGLSKDTVAQLKETNLFTRRLKNDICDDTAVNLQKYDVESNDTLSVADFNNPEPDEDATKCKQQKRHVFPAIRNEYIDFYYGGGRLFHFGTVDGTLEFTTNAKYASVMVNDVELAKDDIRQGKLSGMRVINSFLEGYDRIKENCERYSGPEALGISTVYEKYSWAHTHNGDKVVLDIEASFGNDERRQNRIDLVLYDTKEKLIRFFEVKHFSNRKSLRSKTTPDVVEQIKRYREQLKNQKNDILSAYQRYVEDGNLLFNKQLPPPEKIDTEPRLLVFGFDDPQNKYYEKQIQPKLHGVINERIGNIRDLKMEKFFNR